MLMGQPKSVSAIMHTASAVAMPMVALTAFAGMFVHALEFYEHKVHSASSMFGFLCSFVLLACTAN